MKRLGVTAAVLMLSMLCAAQGIASPPQANGSDAAAQQQTPDEGIKSSRAMFGHLCGIADTSVQSAIGLSRSLEGEWRLVTAGWRPLPTDNAAARVWRESNWMVDLHDSPGLTMHTGQMCFAASGRLMLLIDHYLDLPKCACVRTTALTFAANDGRVIRREQKFMSAETGAEIAAPEAANEFPEVFGFRRVEQLPFYPLLKK